MPRRPKSALPLVDRETAWIRFNQRVLEEAQDVHNPLLERVRFLQIFLTNLDEFFMIRVSGTREQVAAGISTAGEDGWTPRQRLLNIRKAVLTTLSVADRVQTELVAALADHDIRVFRYADLTEAQRARFDAWYDDRIHPILTPLAVSPALPFPFISNLSLNLAARVRSDDGERRLVRIKVPDHLPRYLVVNETTDAAHPPLDLVAIEELIAANLHKLFPGMKVTHTAAFRVTRDADVEIHEDEGDDLLKVIEVELRKRRFGHAVRLEMQADAHHGLVHEIQRGLDLDDSMTYLVPRILDPDALARLVALDLPGLKFAPFTPRLQADLQGPGIFARIRQRDVLLHHPFDSFAPTAEFVRQAARDPAVVAIKMTLYRTNSDSPILAALLDALENGKQVAAVVELKARFDEKNNIVWARRLETAGCHVIYGVPHLKTHAKLCLVVRREAEGLVRYGHIGTGNYNPNTARVYTDFGLFTAHPEITADMADLFNQITGFARPPGFRQMLVAPSFMKRALLEQIATETAHAKAGHAGHIVLKCNTLTDPMIHRALVEASQAGVRVDVIIRGACTLAPGHAGLTEHLHVRSVIGRFLEHSRVYWFANAGAPRMWTGSADLMSRNLDRRIEVLTPVLDPGHAAWLRDVYLERYLTDVARTRVMGADGTYARLPHGEADADVHRAFLNDD